MVKKTNKQTVSKASSESRLPPRVDLRENDAVVTCQNIPYFASTESPYLLQYFGYISRDLGCLFGGPLRIPFLAVLAVFVFGF